ncbi:HlyD family secretion protein [Chromohalobacter israelensis]|uniref:HlyD family secretion protein n=1 Tax=Chromohalobacter israelensis TaxID=141390 RepID=UPI001CC36236|nr:HlyD family secretion protein [Chromohalobacter salexigens]MBZ5876052.1 HlyD family secretion protein [Chromohalobacter salexigens]
MKIKKRLYTALALVVLVVLALVWGVHWWQTGRFFEETDNAYVHADSVAVRAEVTGRVAEVAVADNQRVAAGDILVKLDPSDAKSQLAQAQASLAVAQANAVSAARQVEQQQAAIEEAQARVTSAQADVEQARLHLERSQRLAEKNYASQQEYQDDQAALQVAEATLAARRATLASSRKQLDVLNAERDSAEANIEAARADLDNARHQLDKTRLRAPVAGVIGNKTVEVGTLAQPSLTLMHLVPIRSAYVVANYKETQTARMRPGQSVSLHVDAYPDIAFEGVVDSLAPATGSRFSLLPNDNATGNFNKIVQRVPVRIRVTGPEEALGRLRDGLSVVPTVDTRDLDPEDDA